MTDLKNSVLKLATEEYFENYFTMLEKKSSDIVFSENFEKKMNKLIDSHNKISFKLTYTKARKIICIIVAIIVLMCSSLSVSAIRNALKNFLVTQFSNNANVKYKPVPADNESYPKTIEEIYELGYVPDGYTLNTNTDSGVSIINLYFDNTQTKYISFIQTLKDEYDTHIDNERSTVSHEKINNQEYLIYYWDDTSSYCFIWDNGKYILEVSGCFSKEEMIKICESIKTK